jgi:hypothetical protein
MRTFLRSFLLLGVGAGAGALLIAWTGARSLQALKSGAPASQAELGTGAVASSTSPVAIPHPEFTPATVPAVPRVSGAQHIRVAGTPPIPPIPSAAVPNQPKFQPNGLPHGVEKNQFDPEVYKKLPGDNPPTINYDLRDNSA